MKTIFTSLILLMSSSAFSQYNRFDKSLQITSDLSNEQVTFNWEKDLVKSIIIKSLDVDFYFPKIDAFMTSQLTLNSLSKGKYEVIFLDDCNAIIETKQFEIK